MIETAFRTPAGTSVTAVRTDEMRAVDRVAVEELGLQLLQMTENAGRILAEHVRAVRDDEEAVVVAGNGGNGGGGLACARHLANRNVPVRIVLDRPPRELSGAAATQIGILREMAVPITTGADGITETDQTVLVDALIGYGLQGTVRSPTDRYIETMRSASARVVSLDVPSGIDATTGKSQDIAVDPDRTLTLALPKAGLETVDGTLYLADIAIPRTVYQRLDIEYACPFEGGDWIELAAE